MGSVRNEPCGWNRLVPDFGPCHSTGIQGGLPTFLFHGDTYVSESIGCQRLSRSEASKSHDQGLDKERWPLL